MDKVGVVVPVRNRLGRTRRFVQRFLQQTYQEYVLFLVDSNSTDGTADWLKSIESERLVYVQAHDDDFWTGATNAGVKAALAGECEYILTINDDSIPSNDLLESLLRCAHRGGYRIVGSRINFLQQPATVWSVGSYNVWGTHRLFQLRDFNLCEDDLALRYSNVSCVPVDLMAGDGVLIHRAVFDKIGLYDDVHCPHYHADSEFVMRATARGIHGAICLDAVVFNDVSSYHDAKTGVTNVDARWPFEGVRMIGRRITRLKNLARVYFHRRSDRRLKTAYYIIMTYAPTGKKWRTFGQYAAHTTFEMALPRIGNWLRRYSAIRERITANHVSAKPLLLALWALARSNYRRRIAMRTAVSAFRNWR